MSPLQAALKQRDDIAAEIRPIDARIEKLERLMQSASPAVSERTALHNDHERALKDWVANPESDTPPELDVDRLSASRRGNPRA